MTEPPISPARQALARGDLPGVTRAAQGMLATRPDHAEALFLLGLALAGMGQVREGSRGSRLPWRATRKANIAHNWRGC
ncbi:hypothetical protein ACFS32_24255 [Novosphingobium pokkalii]|uniref:hypothetical protein n=1 Tax=Novosphingobium pokkalii TaxID=1770194 RepID=UPI003628B4E3